MSFVKIGQKAEAENIETVSFGSCVLRTTLNTGIDGNAPSEFKRDVTITVELSDNEHVVQHMLDRVAAGIRITLNQQDGYLKGRPESLDAESYAEMLDDMECKIHLTEEDLIDLYRPATRAQTDEEQAISGLKKMYKAGKLTDDQFKQAVEMVQAASE